MAKNIKTRILLPRGTVDSFSTRTFIAGELVLINDGSVFRPVEITSAGTGLTGDGAAAYAELELSALQIKLSSNVTLQSAYDSIASTVNGLSTYAQIAAQLSSDGYALTTNVVGTTGDLSSADTINGAKKYAKLYVDQEAAKKNAIKIAQTFSGDQIQSDLSVIKVTDSDLAAYSAALKSDSLDPNALYVLNLSATNAFGQKIENVADGAAATDAATYGQLTAAIAGINSGLSSYALSDDVYGKDQVYTKDELTSTSNGVLTAYYKKAETSAATELKAEFAKYAKTNDIGISYDSASKKIYLAGGNSTSAEINASDFIKDGMLSDAFYDTGTKQLVLVFNTDAGASNISVDIGDLVDTYTANDTSTIDMNVAENTFTASIINGSITPDLLSSTAEWVFDCNI